MAITTAASLDAAHDSDNIIKTQTTAMPNVDIPQGMDTCGSPRLEHQFELTDNAPITPHDSPLPEGYTPGSDEGRLKLQELMTICTKLSKQVKSSDDDLDEQDASKHGRSIHTLFLDGTPMEINMLTEKVPTDQGIIGEDVELAVRS
ncbi:hypothetical protein Tco_0373435 [Tanacetum coccineum]